MNVAIIDIGSNNIKLEVHDIDERGNSNLLHEEKVPARLGHEVFITQKLAEPNKQAAIEGLLRLKKISEEHNCDEIIALGTAALREANEIDFIDQVSKETGIKIEIISGVEEARLVYSGVLAHTPFNNKTFFLNDIGGGSTEVSIANGKQIFNIESLRLGTVRLKEMFSTEEFGGASVKMMESYVKRVFSPFKGAIGEHSAAMGLSTGGTARNLAEMIKSAYGTVKEDHGLPLVQVADLRKLVEKIKEADTKELEKMKGLDPARVDIILPGAIILLAIYEALEIQSFLVSPYGLRDGALVDYIFNKVNPRIYEERQNQYRYSSIEKISAKFNLNENHARQTARIAGMIFETVASSLHIPLEYKEILEAAAMLHDTGKFIDYSQHHKHSFYLIMNSALLGFSESEKMMIALTARYHRKSAPKSSHLEFQALDKSEQEKVLKMASMLRIADSLDRSSGVNIENVQLKSASDDQITLSIMGTNDVSLEQWSLERQSGFFEKAIKRTIRLEAVPA